MNVDLYVNGSIHRVALDPRTTLLDALRDRMGLTGTKPGCRHGQCGACTVLIEGHRILSCLRFAWTTAGQSVTTIEGLADGDELHPVQVAFLEHDGLQCGYCTPGQVMSAVGLLAEGIPDNREDIREAMSGNLCRCGAYAGIVAAVEQVREQSMR